VLRDEALFMTKITTLPFRVLEGRLNFGKVVSTRAGTRL
jgi:hypothetical protein